MSTTPLHGVAKADFLNYEALRRSGLVNMHSARAGEYLGLTREEIRAIRAAYNDMAAVWITPSEEPLLKVLQETWDAAGQRGQEE